MLLLARLSERETNNEFRCYRKKRHKGKRNCIFLSSLLQRRDLQHNMRMMSGNLSNFSIIKTPLKAAGTEASPPTLQGNNQRNNFCSGFLGKSPRRHFPYNLLKIQDSYTISVHCNSTATYSKREKLSFVSNTQSIETKSEKSGIFEVSSENCKAFVQLTSSSCIYARHFHRISQFVNLSSGKAHVSHESFRILIALGVRYEKM